MPAFTTENILDQARIPPQSDEYSLLYETAEKIAKERNNNLDNGNRTTSAALYGRYIEDKLVAQWLNIKEMKRPIKAEFLNQMSSILIKLAKYMRDKPVDSDASLNEIFTNPSLAKTLLNNCPLIDSNKVHTYYQFKQGLKLQDFFIRRAYLIK